MEQCMQAMIEDGSPMDSPAAPWPQDDSNPAYISEAQ